MRGTERTDDCLRRIRAIGHRLLCRAWPRRRREQARDRLQKALFGANLVMRLEALETRIYESRDEEWERAHIRWRAAKPDAHLTWGSKLEGRAFASKLAEYGVLGAAARLLEVGPGYGRLLSACLERGECFGSYLGIEISHENVLHLRQTFPQENVAFIEGDVEEIELNEPIDTIISSLTFKHLFPSFKLALTNLSRYLSPGGRVVFDLIEGHRRYFEDDGLTYIRWYSRAEVESILDAAGLELVAFDEVRHRPDVSRLLVVARRPRSSPDG